MAFHIRDPQTDKVVRELARAEGTSITEAVRIACEEKLARRHSAFSPNDRIRLLQEELEAYGRTGLEADKAFYDSLNDE